MLSRGTTPAFAADTDEESASCSAACSPPRGLTRWSAHTLGFSSVERTWLRARSTSSPELSSWLWGKRNSTESGLDRAATGATTVDATAAATAINGGWWGAEPIADCTGALDCAVEGS